MATITPANTNATLTLVAATSGGDSVAMGTSQRCAFIVNNGSGSSINVTITPIQTCNQGFVHAIVTAVAAGVERTIALLPAYQDTNGNVAITYSAVTTVTVAALNT